VSLSGFRILRFPCLFRGSLTAPVSCPIAPKLGTGPPFKLMAVMKARHAGFHLQPGGVLVARALRSIYPKLTRSGRIHLVPTHWVLFTASSPCRKRSSTWRYILIDRPPQGPSRQPVLCALLRFFEPGARTRKTATATSYLLIAAGPGLKQASAAKRFDVIYSRRSVFHQPTALTDLRARQFLTGFLGIEYRTVRRRGECARQTATAHAAPSLVFDLENSRFLDLRDGWWRMLPGDSGRQSWRKFPAAAAGLKPLQLRKVTLLTPQFTQPNRGQKGG